MSEILQSWHLLGLTIGVCTFLVIGLFHPVVIKCEYHSAHAAGGGFCFSDA